MALLGAILPLVPTTPFLLLSAWFFARSSKKWHQWLLDSRLFGPFLKDWETHRCVKASTKAVAIGTMIVVGGLSVTFAVEQTWIRVGSLGLITLGAIVVLSLKTCPSTRHSD